MGHGCDQFGAFRPVWSCLLLSNGKFRARSTPPRATRVCWTLAWLKWVLQKTAAKG